MIKRNTEIDTNNLKNYRKERKERTRYKGTMKGKGEDEITKKEKNSKG